MYQTLYDKGIIFPALVPLCSLFIAIDVIEFYLIPVVDSSLFVVCVSVCFSFVVKVNF